MKKVLTVTLAAMILGTSAVVLAAPARGEVRSQEYVPYPETNSACCCGGDVREERGDAPKQ